MGSRTELIPFYVASHNGSIAAQGSIIAPGIYLPRQISVVSPAVNCAEFAWRGEESLRSSRCRRVIKILYFARRLLRSKLTPASGRSALGAAKTPAASG
jgi:hypothetical protein